MKLNVYSVFDAKLACFGRPWYEMTDASAIRVFTDAVNDGSNVQNQWHRHPEDFSLFVIGTFEDSNGMLKPSTPLSLVTASAVYDYKRDVEELDEPDLFSRDEIVKKPAVKN